MIFTIGDIDIDIIENGDRMVFHMLAGHGFEPDSLKVWSGLVQSGKVALDVGAYTGIYSILASKRGAQAIAMEPMPANFWRLGVNVAANKATVMLLDVAASDEDGFVTLNYSRHTPMTTGASLEKGIKGHTDTHIVNRIRIDALALNNVAAIKIDVERHEPCVIRGALNTIERDRPAMIIECLDEAMRMAVLHSLPSYEVVAILDGRNTLFLPK